MKYLILSVLLTGCVGTGTGQECMQLCAPNTVFSINPVVNKNNTISPWCTCNVNEDRNHNVQAKAN